MVEPEGLRSKRAPGLAVFIPINPALSIRILSLPSVVNRIMSSSLVVSVCTTVSLSSSCILLASIEAPLTKRLRAVSDCAIEIS